MSDLQSHLDNDVSALADVINQLEAEISGLKTTAAQPSTPPLDFSGADALVASAKAAVASLGTTPTASAAGPGPDATSLAGPADVPPGSVGAGYSATLVATGGTAPYSFAVEGLPAGLTASGGAISGTPQATGTSTLTITVTDANGAMATSWPILAVS